MQKYTDVVTIIGPPGLIPVVGANVTVWNYGTSTSANIFSSNSTSDATGNPLTTDSSGRFSFYAADGRYSLQMSAASIQTTVLTDIELFDASSSTSAASINFLQSGIGAIAQTTQGKLRRIKELDDRQDVDNTGASSVLTPFTNAIADVGSGGRLIVRKGTYLIPVTSAATSLLLPSGFWLDCEEGTIFRWSGMGAFPLFAAVEKEDVLITGATFEWNGTLAEVAGSLSDFNGWTGTLANRDLAAHVLSLGSTGVRIKHCSSRTVGDNPSAATEAFYIFAGFFPSEDDTTRTADNAVEDCRIDDVVQGVLLSAQDNFRFKKITSRRFPGNHPVGGGSGVAGHLVYVSENGLTTRSRGVEIDDVVDHGASFGTITNRTDTSVQVKCADGAIVKGVTSRRPTGIFSFAEFVKGVVSDSVWAPATVQTHGCSSATTNSTGLEDSILRGLNFYLPDNTDKGAWNFNSMARCVVSAHISASHTTTSISSSILTTCVDNKISIDYAARNTTSVQPVNLITSSLRNVIEVTPIGQNHTLRPFVNDGCTGNVIRMFDNVAGKWSNLTHWTTEADSPSIGFAPIVKTKVYRIATTTDPTTTFQLPRAGVWVGTVSLMDSSGAHSLSGRYRIAWDTGSLQSVELIGTQWTVGASAPTVLGLAVSNAGVVTVTSTAGSAAWDIQYHFSCEGNYRYADF